MNNGKAEIYDITSYMEKAHGHARRKDGDGRPKGDIVSFYKQPAVRPVNANRLARLLSEAALQNYPKDETDYGHLIIADTLQKCIELIEDAPTIHLEQM